MDGSRGSPISATESPSSRSASHSLISDYFPPGTRTKALALSGLGYPVGGLTGTVVAGVALDHWGWRRHFYLSGRHFKRR